MQGFRGIGLQEEEKDLTNAQSRLNKLKEQLDKNPESGDEEQEYVTGEVELFGTDKDGNQRKRKKKRQAKRSYKTRRRKCKETY